MPETPRKLALYASVGNELTHYDIDVEGAALTRRAAVRVRANVQYVWPHATQPFLYVATSDSASGMGPAGANHHVSALRIDSDSGALSHVTVRRYRCQLGRPIHMATDVPSEHVLVAFNNPSAVHIYRIDPDGTPGAEVAQPNPIDPGIFAHQVRATPDNKQVILVTRGHDPAGSKPEEPGALKIFDFAGGVLSNEQSVAPNGGYGFGPRHLDFHPTKPWVYVSLERENLARRVLAGKWQAVGRSGVPRRQSVPPGAGGGAPGGRHRACPSSGAAGSSTSRTARVERGR